MQSPGQAARASETAGDLLAALLRQTSDFLRKAGLNSWWGMFLPGRHTPLAVSCSVRSDRSHLLVSGEASGVLRSFLLELLSLAIAQHHEISFKSLRMVWQSSLEWTLRGWSARVPLRHSILALLNSFFVTSMTTVLDTLAVRLCFGSSCSFNDYSDNYLAQVTGITKICTCCIFIRICPAWVDVPSIWDSLAISGSTFNGNGWKFVPDRD